MKYTKRNWAAWAAAAGIRAAKTFGQSAAAVLVSSLAGLPELPDADGDGIPDSAEGPES